MAEITYSPTPPRYGDTLVIGYDPKSPVLKGHRAHLVVRSNASTKTDFGQIGAGRKVLDESKSIAQGTAAQRTTFVLDGDSTWSGGGGDASVELIDEAGAIVDSTSFTVIP